MHRSGCAVHFKNHLPLTFFVCGFLASTYIAPFLGRRFEMHWFGQCENSLDTNTRFFPAARRPAQVFALQHWKHRQFRQCKTLAFRQLRNRVFYTVLELCIIPVTLNINQSQCNDCVTLDYLIINFHSQRVKSYSVDFNGLTTWQFDNR